MKDHVLLQTFSKPDFYFLKEKKKGKEEKGGIFSFFFFCLLSIMCTLAYKVFY